MSKHVTKIILSLMCILLITGPSTLSAVAQGVDLHALDSDGDTISDWDEINRYWSDPYSRDSDSDGINDAQEVETGTSPIDTDSDGDHFSDAYEYSVWNPLASNIEDRFYRCPYIADLPSVDVDLVDGEDNIVLHYYYTQGEETREATIVTEASHIETKDGWGHKSKFDINNFVHGSDYWNGLRTQRVGDLSFTVGYKGAVGLYGSFTGKGYFYLPSSYLSTGAWNKRTWGDEFARFNDYSRTTISLDGTEDKDTYENFINQGFDYSKVTLIANLRIRNNFDRIYRLDNILFNFTSNGIVHNSKDWTFDSIVLGVGDNQLLTVSFDIEGEEWIQDILWSEKSIQVNPQFLEVSVYDDEDGWISQEIMEEDVTSRCAKVEIVENDDVVLHKYITATVDKIDGLNVLETFDGLFQEYEYKYGRLRSLRDIPSTPGEEVWSFKYFDRYFDTSSSGVDEYNYEKIRMWGRGFLVVNLDSDSDGDWLPDCIDPFPGEPDHDNDYADDYMEIVLMGTQPDISDTDGGGTIDGIEYYEGLDPLDASDDLLELPSWYQNHVTVQNSETAAEYLLQIAEHPDTNQITWPAPMGGTNVNTSEYDGEISYATNETIDQVMGESILCIDTGDVDGDNFDEIVVGTYPKGYVILFDNETGSWEGSILGNLSNYYANSQVKVWDVEIGDADNDLDMDIVVGSWYNDGLDKGDIIMYYQFDDSWYNTIVDTVPGGVHSIAIDDVYDSSSNQIIIGSGGSETAGNGQIITYTGSVGSWSSDIIATLISPMTTVVVGDYGSNGINKIVYCTNSLNSTLGFCEYNTVYSNWTQVEIDTQYVLIGDPPPYVRYMTVQLGDPENKGKNFLFVAVDNSSAHMDQILKYGYKKQGPSPIINSLDFSGPNLLVGDIDNDGSDDIAWHNYDPTQHPYSELSICTYNGTSLLNESTFIENTTDQYIHSISFGDIDNDNENELIYGSFESGLLRYWDHPAGFLWPSQELEWTVQISMPQGPIYEDEVFSIDVLVENHGNMTISDLNISTGVPFQISHTTASQYTLSPLSSNMTALRSFGLSPTTSGIYDIEIICNSGNPSVSFSYEFELLVKPRLAYQVQIGRAILEVAKTTGDQVLLDAAMHFGNWLHERGIRFATTAAWNSDANNTAAVLSGHILATVQTGEFFLELFRASGDLRFLSDAFLAARYLVDTAGPQGVWSTTENGVFEAAEAGLFFYHCNRQFMTNFFNPSIDDIATYLNSIKSTSTDGIHWFGSFKLTGSVIGFLNETGRMSSLSPLNWLVTQAQDSMWLQSLEITTSSGNPYNFFTETGLAGVLLALSRIEVSGPLNAEDEIEVIADVLVDASLVTGQGTNWQESTWTSNLTKLYNSIDWDVGAAGIMTALTDAYRIHGTQEYLNTMLDGVTWVGHSIDEIISSEANSTSCAGALSDSIVSLLHVHSTLPVVSVGYFVDPMTSLEGGGFNVTGYVQTIGWHAQDVNITIVLPGIMLLENGQQETIDLGVISDPGVQLETWEVTYIPTTNESLYYGIHELGIEVDSSNAGSHSTDAHIELTDLGVEKVGEDEPLTRFTSLSISADIEDQYYSVAQDVLLPIRVEYQDGQPAINASVSVGDYGRGIVNASGYAYFPVTSYEPGEIEIPISLEYDKTTGITSGTSNATVNLLFTNLEVYDVLVGRTTAVLGELITIEGKVRYSHNQEIASGAMVFLGNVTNATADASGVFRIEYSGSVIGTETLQLFALIDGNGQFFVPTQWTDVELVWTGFWTPLNTVLILAGGAGAALIVGVIVLKMRKRETT